MPAARGSKPSNNEAAPIVGLVKQESLGGDSIKSNKIKKISFLKSNNQAQMQASSAGLMNKERKSEGYENPAPLPS